MTRVALLWHMHQPFYVDGASGAHVLPWVRLHALKDYWGMAALVEEFPALRVTFNLVPSLLVQIDAFARGDAVDRHLELGLRPASDLTPDEVQFCVEEFFHAHHGRMVAPHARYQELFERRQQARSGGSPFTTVELRDLQVWHKLAWVDPLYADDSRIAALHRKGRGFAEEDKATLRDVELEILRRVIPEYREAQNRGQVELSTSPFYHAILPLLCDVGVYRATHPAWPPPEEPFAHPGDALDQLERAVALHTGLFGARPAGLWPSEGAVSDAMVEIVRRAGFSWMATDEEILGQSRGLTFRRDSDGVVHHAAALYQPYKVGGEAGGEGPPLACGFRDHALSDLIGFTYASWAAEDAARDFVRRVAAAGASAAADGVTDPVVFVILDGENAWEHFEGQGRPFLRALYRELTSREDVQTVVMRDACRAPAEHLDRLHPGSWIHSDFYIWAGHADDRRAWAQLARARRRLDELATGRPGLERARESLLIAEGSDWFWWYGDDHSSDHDQAFDQLFRGHVSHAYLAMGDPVPAELLTSNITTDAAILPTSPWVTLSPAIDGAESSYFEWMGSGWFDTREVAGAMHQVTQAAPPILGIRYGYDARHLYLCAVPKGQGPVLAHGSALVFSFPDVGVHLAVEAAGQIRAEDGRGKTLRTPSGCRAATGRSVELQIPLAALGGHTVAGLTLSLAQRDGKGVAVRSWTALLTGPGHLRLRDWRA
jgi:alpha-amylase/alpha-mannosidase (GH57 family)